MKGAELLSKHPIFILQIEDRSGGAGSERLNRKRKGRKGRSRGHRGMRRSRWRKYQGLRKGRNIGGRRGKARRKRNGSGRRKNRVAERTTTSWRKPTSGRVRSGRYRRKTLGLRRTTGKLPFLRGDRVGGRTDRLVIGSRNLPRRDNPLGLLLGGRILPDVEGATLFCSITTKTPTWIRFTGVPLTNDLGITTPSTLKEISQSGSEQRTKRKGIPKEYLQQ